MGFDIGGLVGGLVNKFVGSLAGGLAKGVSGSGGFDFGKIFSDAIQSMFKDSNDTGNKAASKAGDLSDVVKGLFGGGGKATAASGTKAAEASDDSEDDDE